MKKIVLFLLLLSGISILPAQNRYPVKTENKTTALTSKEEQLIAENFPFIRLCDWEPGMKFKVVPDNIDMIISTFKLYDTKKDVENKTIAGKIFEFTGTEEYEKSLRFLFQSNGVKYYHELKYKMLDTYCEEKPKADIKTLAYLGDVDKAKEVLLGKALYSKTNTLRIDDNNSYKGYREVKIPLNTRLIVTAIGTGSKQFPVRLTLTDKEGKSYYTELAFSRTNSGMSLQDFQGMKKYSYFTNAFSLKNANYIKTQTLGQLYLNKTIYPPETIEVTRKIKQNGKSINSTIKLPRYTLLTISNLRANGGNNVTLTLKDNKSNIYYKQVTFAYNAIIKPKNYFDDLFILGNIHNQYPDIPEANWPLISKGEIKDGMTKEECRLALGNPTLIRKSGKNGELEEWVYRNTILNFDNGKLMLKNK